MKKLVVVLLLLFCALAFGAEVEKNFSIAIASEVKTFKASWDYNCPAGLVIHFRLYVKDGDQWQMLKEMSSYCTKDDQETKHFEELFEWEIPTLGEDYVFGLTAVNDEDVESDVAKSTVHIPLPVPSTPQNFRVEVQ